jgi:hypothetical protein
LLHSTVIMARWFHACCVPFLDIVNMARWSCQHIKVIP